MDYLDELDIPYTKSCKTGVIATIKGKQSSDKVLGIRADIDALPVQDLAEVSWKSKKEGSMHYFNLQKNAYRIVAQAI